MADGGLLAGRESGVRLQHRSDRLHAIELMRERLDARLSQARQLRAPSGEQIREIVRAATHRPPRYLSLMTSFPAKPEKRHLLHADVDLCDLELARGSSGNLHRNGLVALAAKQRTSDRRLVGELVLGGLGLGGADDRVARRLARLLVLDVDDRADRDNIRREALGLMTVAIRSLSATTAIRASSIACSFLASSYSEFLAMSPNSRASLMRSATSRRFSVEGNRAPLGASRVPPG